MTNQSLFSTFKHNIFLIQILANAALTSSLMSYKVILQCISKTIWEFLFYKKCLKSQNLSFDICIQKKKKNRDPTQQIRSEKGKKDFLRIVFLLFKNLKYIIKRNCFSSQDESNHTTIWVIS